ncbi:helicase HerA-like domain-containing protein [Candidatus Nanohalovita haloferacivicina]|uniref:helicase HerA-like domain-containing protein n=1 Tax=Candidatus Nanohalovita haloferacivicina TaxID=2978046 RepID=UPI00325F96A7|nr:Archaeal DNA helicase HerA [Candidatus Nanohalobia archaeon BNXNv]
MKKTAIILLALSMMTATAAADISVNDDIPSLSVIFKSEPQIYTLSVTNNGNTTEDVTVTSRSDLRRVLDLNEQFSLSPGQTRNVKAVMNTTNDLEEGLYLGSLLIQTENTEKSLPVGARVVTRRNAEFKIDMQATIEEIRPNENIRVLTVLSSSTQGNISAEVTYDVREAQTGRKVFETTRNTSFVRLKSYRHTIEPNESLSTGDYYIQGHATRGNRTITATDTFQVTNPFWTATRIKLAILLLAGGLIIGGGFYTRRWYQEHMQEEARYVFPVDYSKLPDEGDGDQMFEVGKIAETEKSAYINPKDLTTHAIVAGSTGSGKSVTANIIAEEALEQDIPVVVFDPTAQWTGFVKELKDDNLLEHYDRFDMNKDTDPHPYPGVIKEIKSEDPDIDFEELRNPGEITVFTLNQLTTEQFDKAVRKIIDQIFEKEWEESPTLELFIVFDEVHRLLEEYGGEGGYKALEKGAREFRKWGIGLMMCSQVTADFKQAISGNIMTEVQMQTKSMEDIKRIEKKYGEQFSKRISSEDVGTGMIQNSNYNDGDPWFVDFRPTYHNPHKIPDEELDQYHELTEEMDKVKDKVQELEDQGQDMQDKQLEINLADNKLKEGRFKMARMYIESLKDELDIS